MSVTADIWRTWRAGPSGTVRGFLRDGPGETRAFAFLMGGCALAWLSQWPRFRIEALRAPEGGPDFVQLAGVGLVVWLMVLPLGLYLVAALTHAASRALGGRGPASATRLALFWSWLAAAPVALLSGVAWAFTGASPLTNVVAVAWLLAFAVLWALAQREARRAP